MGDGGNVTINSNQVVFEGNSNAQSQVQPGANGNAGNIEINITSNGSVSLTDSFLLTNAQEDGIGNGGDVTINAPKGTVSLDNNSQINTQVLGPIEAQGNAGNIEITTDNLKLTNNSSLNTQSFRNGDAGNVTITTTDTVSFEGSLLQANVPANVEGNGGQVTIDTGELSLESSTTNGVDQDSKIIVNNEGTGNASNVIINATDRVSFSGNLNVNPDEGDEATEGSGIFGRIGNQNNPDAVGTGSQITITTRELSLTDGADISTQIFGQTGSQPGNIILNVEELRLNDSDITTNATEDTDGGNITIGNNNSPADFLLLQNNSSITANAVQGNGGNITIDSLGFFQCRNCEIDASSAFGLDGNVEINTVISDTFETETLSTDVIPPQETIAQTCARNRGRSKSFFIITGRGGIPPRPTDVLAPEDLIRFSPPSPRHKTRSRSSLIPNTNPPPQQLVEATGWYRRADGVVVLTANPPNTNPGLFHSSSCQSNNK